MHLTLHIYVTGLLCTYTTLPISINIILFTVTAERFIDITFQQLSIHLTPDQLVLSNTVLQANKKAFRQPSR